MKRIVLLQLVLFGLFYCLQAQSTKTELGFFLGTSYYHGDINTSRIFYSPGIAAGAIFKYNLDRHLSGRISATYGTISGNDYDFSSAINQSRGAAFSSSLVDVNLILEFNFLPYSNTGFIKYNNDRLAPFVFIGVGANYLMGSGSFSNPLNFPFGLGIKYNIFERLTLGAEWSYRKTFNDEIDGVLNISDTNNSPILHNADWYSFFGVFLTYKLSKDKLECPTYD